MLRLSNLITRIEALEREESSDIDERLSTWYAMVSWQFFVAQYGDAETAKKALHSLPNDHPMRVAVGKLTWFTCYFVSTLPDVTWKSEKAEIAFAAWLEEAIAEGFTESALCCETAMNDAIEFTSTCLINGTLSFYDELKKQEQENWTKKLEFRRLANFGELSEEAIEWLKTFDAGFWENHIKKQSEVKPEVRIKPIETEVIPQVITPIESVQPVTDGPVRLKYVGGWRGFNITTIDGIESVEPGSIITVPPFVWENIQNGNMPKSWWVRL